MTDTPASHQQALTERQFGASASAYLTSAVHAGGADLDRLAARAADAGLGEVLDLGCGAGHASFALARAGAGRVLAYDLSRDMLEVVSAEATRRGHAQLLTRQGPAEELPFESGRFDWVVTRYSAHHWRDVPAALAEAGRVLSPGGRLIVIDIVAPESPLLDTVLQSVEFLRDASHVRNYRVSEWRRMLDAAGFAHAAVEQWKLRLDFQPWVERIRTPAPRVAALHAVFGTLTGEVRDYFAVGADHSFTTDRAWIEAARAS